MASTRTKATFELTQDEEKAKIEFKGPIDYVIVDIGSTSVFISLGYTDKPYDEMITLRLKNETHAIETKKSTHKHNKEGDKGLLLELVKSNLGDEFELKTEHKFVEKKNHPKADPRGYSVRKPADKNWDKIIATLDDSEEEEPDANSALKKIYDGCDEDTRRAMEKSLYESHGTVLSMNWDEVGKAPVEPYKSYDESKPFEGFNKRH